MEPTMRALAATLGQLHRSPGRDEAWVANVLQALERTRPADYDQLRRRLGLARSLAALVPLQDDALATMSIGIFFHELIREEPVEEGGKEPQSWSEYLAEHEDWLAPCLALSKAIDSPDWESCDSKTAAVARIAATLDLEASRQHARPLQTLQSLASDASNEFAQQIIELLWSEEGQRLCQGHFDQRGQRYSMDPDEIRSSLKLLKESPPSKAADPPGASQGSSESDDATNVQGDSAPDSQSSEGAIPADGFEQRLQAVRSRSGLEDQASDGATDSDEQQAPEPSEAREETAMATPDTTGSPSAHDDDRHLLEKVEGLRAKLDQIQKVAAEGQAILESLAPELEEVSSWMTDLETVIERWKRQHESTEAAA
jgi:hypothetical protein